MIRILHKSDLIIMAAQSFSYKCECGTIARFGGRSPFRCYSCRKDLADVSGLVLDQSTRVTMHHKGEEAIRCSLFFQ